MRKYLACVLGGSGRLFMTACLAPIYFAHVRFSRIFARPEWSLLSEILSKTLSWSVYCPHVHPWLINENLAIDLWTRKFWAQPDFRMQKSKIKYFETHHVKNPYCYRPRSEGDNALGSVRPSVCLSVCVRSHGWTVCTTTLIFCMGVDLDRG